MPSKVTQAAGITFTLKSSTIGEPQLAKDPSLAQSNLLEIRHREKQVAEDPSSAQNCLRDRHHRRKVACERVANGDRY